MFTVLPIPYKTILRSHGRKLVSNKIFVLCLINLEVPGDHKVAARLSDMWVRSAISGADKPDGTISRTCLLEPGETIKP